MDKIIRHGLQIAASLDPASQKEMRLALRSIFTDEAHIDLNNPENIKGLQNFSALFKKMFEYAGNKKFNFNKIMQMPGPEMFENLTAAAKEFEGVWDSIVSQLGGSGLQNLFTADIGQLDAALDRLTKVKDGVRVLNKNALNKVGITDAFKDMSKIKNIDKLIDLATNAKNVFTNAVNWEEQSAAAMQYVNVVKQLNSLMTKQGMTGFTEENAKDLGIAPDNLKDFLDLQNIGPYTIQQLERAMPQLSNSLNNIFRRFRGELSLPGLTDGGAANIDVVPKVVKTLDVGDLLGGKKSIELPIDPVFKSNLDKLRDLYIKSNVSDEAYEQFEQLQSDMVKNLPLKKQERAMGQLLKFSELDNVENENYDEVWKDFIKFGLPLGTGSDGESSTIENGVKNNEELAISVQRVKDAYKELEALANDPWNIESEEEVNRIYQERLAIIRRVGEENLKAYNPNMYADVEYINNEYANTLNSFKESKDDKIYSQLDGDLTYYNDMITSSQELEVLLAKRRELMQGIYFDAEQEYAEQEQINQAIERRIALMKELEPLVANGSITQDDLEDMVFEQGDLDEKRSRLMGIQQDLFNLDSSSIDEAQILLDQYEKILVKTAGGKTLTLGPEMSEADLKTFMAMDTEKAKSVEFIRKEVQVHQENAAAISAESQATDNLNDSLQKKKAIENTETSFITEEEVRQAEANYDRLIHKLNLLQEEGAEALTELEKLSKRSQIYGFGSDKTALQESKIQATLAKNNRGKYVVDMLKNGYEAIQTSSGEYGFDRPDLGNGVFTKITKTEYEYAQYLSQKIKELNVGWDEGLKILQSQNGQLEAAKERVNSLNSEYEKTKLESERAYETQTKAHNQWNRQKELQTQEGLNQAKTQQVQIEQSDNDGEEIADENAKTEAIKQQNSALQENINLKAQANRQGVVATTGKGDTATTPTQTTSTVTSGATTTEATQLEAVRAKVAEVTAAVNSKNQAFYNEGQIVGQVVGKENAALISLKGNIDAITSAVNTKNKAFYDEGQIVGQVIGRENAALMSLQGNVNNVASSLGGTLSNLQGVRMPNLGNAVSQTNITNEEQALANLRVRIDEVTSAVRTKTASFVQEETVVRQGVSNEIAALIQLRQNIDNVNTGITTLTQGLNTALNNASAFNGINLNVNAAVDLTTIETALANILTAIPNAGTGAQNNNAGGGQGDQGRGGRGQRGVAQHLIDKLESDLEKYRSGLDAIGNLTQSYNAELDRLLADLGNLRTSGDVSRWRDEFSQFKNIVGMYDNDNKRAVNRMQQATQKDILGNYKEIGKLLAQRETAGSQEEIDSINRRIKMWAALAQEKQNNVNVDKSLRKSAAETARQEALVTNAVKAEQQSFKDNEKEKQKSFKQQVKEAQQEAGVSKSKNTVNTAYDTLSSAIKIQDITPEQQANLDAYRGKIEALRTSIANFPKNGIASEAQKQQLIQQRSEVDAYTKEIQELIANYEKLSGPNVEVMGANKLGKNAAIEDQKKQLSDMVIQYTKGKASIKSYDAATNELKYTMRTASGEFTTYTAALRQGDEVLVTMRGQTTRTMGVVESVVKKVKEFSYYFTGSMMIYRVIALIRQGVTAVKEIDSALIELKKVTDETSVSYNKFLDTASAKAEKLGSTITDVVSATAEFARLGYDMNTATGLAEAAIVYKNVGDGIESASDAAESIISAMKGFGLEATDAMSIVDKFNEVGNNFAIDSKGVGDALTRSASALSAAGNSIDESIGLVTAAMLNWLFI